MCRSTGAAPERTPSSAHPVPAPQTVPPRLGRMEEGKRALQSLVQAPWQHNLLARRAGSPPRPPSPQAEHPALEAVKARWLGGSRPGKRVDSFKVGLVVEGGGMRGVVSGGALQAMHDLEMLDAFDAVYGSSAGAINATYFLSGQRDGVNIYREDVANRRFVDLRRLVPRRSEQTPTPALDLTFLLDEVMQSAKPLDWEAVLASPVPLKVVASCLDTLHPVILENFASAADLFTCLRASANVPEVAGGPVEHRGRRLVDAAVFEPVPFRAAIADGCTHILALCTRPPYMPGRLTKMVDDLMTTTIKRAVMSPEYMRAAWVQEAENVEAFGATVEDMLIAALHPESHARPYFAGTHVFPAFPGAAASFIRPLCLPAEECVRTASGGAKEQRAAGGCQGVMAPAVPLGETAKKKANPFLKPSDKANGASTPPRPPAKGNPFLVDKERAVAANGSAGKPPVNPFPRPAAARAPAAAPAAPAAAAPAAKAALAWAPATPVGREAKAAADRAAAAGAAEAPAALASDLQAGGLLNRLLAAGGLLDRLLAGAGDPASPSAREDALQGLRALAEGGGAAAEPHLLRALPALLERQGDKAASVREAAGGATAALAAHVRPRSVPKVVPCLLDGMAPACAWQTKVGACRMLERLAVDAPGALAGCLPDVVPRVSECMVDAKDQVKVAATAAMERVVGVMGNRDLEPFIPALVSCIVRPAEVPDIVGKLSATTFVQTIEAPALAVMVPLLVKALRERNSVVKRKASIIINNMSKLVLNPADAAPFLPRLLPEVKKVSEDAADPELREVARQAHASLLHVKGHASTADLLSAGIEDEAAVKKHEGEELCNCEFSLAYGGRILLKNTTLHLFRGRRYGLCGANGAGKSTLMRSIAAGQLDGFPPRDVLRTVYVEHDIDASEAETPVVDFVFADKALQEASHPSRQQVEDVLAGVGFDAALRGSPVASLSGGWKMKLALARAMLMKADILLLDEPTNHLDVTNVAWLENYLNNIPEVSSMIVSHDSGFLDNVCTDIIHYEEKKLVPYPGNLSEFVKVKPEARTYYELSAATLKFVFPRPGFLEGIKGRSQAITKMTNVSFTYPGAGKQQLSDVNVRVALSSRIAVLGANGAGKSTLIKLLTGELEPEDGVVWKHPNLRVAYVAQHAFHHVELHLKSTPADYFWWRFKSGEDREGLEKVTRKVTAAEAAQKDADIKAGKLVVEALLGRRKAKRDFEYEVKWWGMPSDPKHNKWIMKSELEGMGCMKMINDLDARIAASKSYRPLSKDAITQHLEDFGMEAEITNHNAILGLSGGQKVKLVLAAAMWNNPHLLVLDEPTNYLDRESLGALASAINDFQGAVIMISHNSEFTSALCTETWFVADGSVAVSGGVAVPVANMAASVSSLSLVSSKAGSASVASLTSLDNLDGPEDLDPEALEERVKEKARLKEEKAAIAAEKARLKAEKKKLRFDRKH
ncbi:hypothetical protein WJX81_000473 [Elliptochloris bilobata]|uniref:Patatin n=1 Tax=Elliptochloris bilobata TaxID=381761 RepID=A0AAW1S2D9_9CHLO